MKKKKLKLYVMQYNTRLEIEENTGIKVINN